MLKTILQTLLFLFIAVVSLGLMVVLFSIGLIALWYLLLIGLIIWGVRRLYYFFKGEKPPAIVEQYYAKKTRGRVINYDEFKDK